MVRLSASTRNTAKVSRRAGAWGCARKGPQPLSDVVGSVTDLDVSQSETSSDSDSDTLTDLEASGPDTPDATTDVPLPSSSSRRVSMPHQLQRRQTSQPHPTAMPASMWDSSTVWAGNIALVRRTDTAVGT